MNAYIDDRVNRDFSQARLRAFLRTVSGTLRRAPTTLLSFEDVRSRLYIRGQRDLGIKAVPLAEIVGSEGRYMDFDRIFLPLSEQTKERWKRIGRAHYEDIHLPPVELYQIGAVYFVRDGNHRISVARQRGQIDIDAHVIELNVDVPLTPDLNDYDLPKLAALSDFLRWTNLPTLRSVSSVMLTEPGGYHALLRHINGHRYFLSLERGQEVSHDEAVGSWYDTVYMPLVSAISWSGILETFPGRTVADLYLWIIDHRHYLRQEVGEDPGARAAVISYAARFGPPKARRLFKRLSVSPKEQRFMDWCGLDQSGRAAKLDLSDPDGWAILRRHITDHQYYLAQERGEPVPIAQAASSWFDHVFQPVVSALLEHEAPVRFPKQTHAELYLLVMDHLSSLREQGIEVDVRGAAQDYTARFGHAERWVRLQRWARQMLQCKLHLAQQSSP